MNEILALLNLTLALVAGIAILISDWQLERVGQKITSRKVAGGALILIGIVISLREAGLIGVSESQPFLRILASVLYTGVGLWAVQSWTRSLKGAK